MSRRPDIKVSIKRKSGGEKATWLLAAWESEKFPGLFTAYLDKSIVRLEIVYADGRRELVDPSTHWINAQMKREKKEDDGDNLPF